MSARPAEGIVLRDLDVDPDDELVERLHREVLRVSFSPDELDGADVLAEGLRDGCTLASIALDADGSVLGGVVAEVYAREHVLLLAYLAVRPDLRGRGIGTQLMEHVEPRWYARTDIDLAVAEVHDPRPWANAAGEDPLARLRLYERMGARVLAVPFVQPALGPGRARVPGFLLLAFHVDRTIEVEEGGVAAIGSDIVGGFVRRYYEIAEGAPDPADSQLNDLLARIEERPTIQLLPIREYDRIPLLA
jgi:GNAT superfamily N-acetyltransferase